MAKKSYVSLYLLDSQLLSTNDMPGVVKHTENKMMQSHFGPKGAYILVGETDKWNSTWKNAILYISISISIYLSPLLEAHEIQVTNQGLNQSPCLGSIAQLSIERWD